MLDDPHCAVSLHSVLMCMYLKIVRSALDVRITSVPTLQPVALEQHSLSMFSQCARCAVTAHKQQLSPLS